MRFSMCKTLDIKESTAKSTVTLSKTEHTYIWERKKFFFINDWIIFKGIYIWKRRNLGIHFVQIVLTLMWKQLLTGRIYACFQTTKNVSRPDENSQKQSILKRYPHVAYTLYYELIWKNITYVHA